MESRIQILDRLSKKWGKQDRIETFDEFCKMYNAEAITQLVYIAMHEYAKQEIDFFESKKDSANDIESNNKAILTLSFPETEEKIIDSFDLDLSRITVMCSDCKKEDKPELIINNFGFKMCKHITHTRGKDGMDIWQ